MKLQGAVQPVDDKTIEQSYMIKFNITAGDTTFEDEIED